jgi:glycosyltransferase domain-containing protein
MPGKICLIVPTHNRPHFMRRLLSYYQAAKAGLRIIVIDSSEPLRAAQNKELVSEANWPSGLQLEYHHTNERFPPEFPPIVHEKVQWALEIAATAYVALCADDDFLVPSALEKFVNFLDQNPDYCCAKGRIFDFIAPKKGVFRLLPALHWRPVKSEDACERVWLASRYYQQSFYGLFRLETLQEIQRSMPQRFLRHPGWLDELSFSTFAAAMGKIMRFDCPYEYRELHDSNFGHVVSKWPETTFEDELRPFVTDYRQALRDLLLRRHPELEEAAANKAAQSSLIAFSKWYYDTRYRDSHNRPRGSGSLERREFLQRLLEKINEMRRSAKNEFLRLRAMRFPETQAVMVAVYENHVSQQ